MSLLCPSRVPNSFRLCCCRTDTLCCAGEGQLTVLDILSVLKEYGITSTKKQIIGFMKDMNIQGVCFVPLPSGARVSLFVACKSRTNRTEQKWGLSYLYHSDDRQTIRHHTESLALTSPMHLVSRQHCCTQEVSHLVNSSP